ncbi:MULTISPECIES: DUF488 domain-containing protein [unclassified Paraburkholderia]|uniref:DUF488 domain-containing protein n=1 Tax=unclassified Paraburkholderia TaxID=2615204 RepID=UPI001980AFB4|nr:MULTISPECIES: DUF488 family protein [unclassified Paraburkholderia]MBN3853779.1 DUF488 family protein [Paraburkholderia sp. Ac-20340]
MSAAKIALQRVYEALPEGREHRFLVDRLWPRGISKERLAGVTWAKEAAPSTALRQWFHANQNDPAHWDEFERRYLAELAANHDAWAPLAEAAHAGPIVLLYGSHDAEHNHAIVLRDFLLKHLPKKRRHA